MVCFTKVHSKVKPFSSDSAQCINSQAKLIYESMVAMCRGQTVELAGSSSRIFQHRAAAQQGWQYPGMGAQLKEKGEEDGAAFELAQVSC